MNVLYAIPTHKCNLSCPHCTIKDHEEKYDHIAFMSQLNNFDGHIILFGGEPTADRERLRAIIHSRKHTPYVSEIGSISTNLIILDDELIELYKEIGYVATSWNLTRFTDLQYGIWKANLCRLASAGIKPGVLITLTDDLLDYPMEEFLKIVDEWHSDYVSWIQFEHLISEDNTPEYYEKADNWLCELYKAWRSKIYVRTFDISLRWYYDCSHTYTLEPDGVMHNICPNAFYCRKTIPEECMLCEKATECKPCWLHAYCSYPKKLRTLIEKSIEREV